jgi:hypothetical protein
LAAPAGPFPRPASDEDLPLPLVGAAILLVLAAAGLLAFRRHRAGG